MTGAILVSAPLDLPEGDLREAASGRPVVLVNEMSERACRDRGIDPRDVGAVLGASPRDDLTFLPSLQWVHSATAGVDQWLEAGAVPPGVTLTSAAGNGAVPLSEHALMMMLMLSRDSKRTFAAQQRHEWDRFTHGELTGLTLGLIGYGNSGQDLAVKAQACHMHVLALRRTPSGVTDGKVRLLYGLDGLRQLLATSDFVAVTTPLTANTRGLIGAEQLGWMKPTAFVIVVSRGGIVDEGALAAAVLEGRLAGAGLDAHEVEPLPPESLFWDMPNVIVTPHHGATTPLTGERGRAIMLANVARWVRGEPLRNVVDAEAGY